MEVPLRRFMLFFGLSLVTLALVHSPDALAGKKDKGAEEEKLPSIVMTGIAEFDDVYGKAKNIHDSLDAENKSLKSARDGLNTALGVATDAPFKTALDDLQAKADKKIKVVMKGKTPRLEPTDAVPDNVRQGIDAVNQVLDASEHAADTAIGLKPEAEGLVKATMAFPGKLPGMGLDPKALMDARKKITDNNKAVGATPDRVERVAKTSEGIFGDVKATFTE